MHPGSHWSRDGRSHNSCQNKYWHSAGELKEGSQEESGIGDGGIPRNAWENGGHAHETGDDSVAGATSVEVVGSLEELHGAFVDYRKNSSHSRGAPAGLESESCYCEYI